MNFDIAEYQNTIYHDPQRYDDQYWWKKNDIEFWKTIYHKISGTKILELGSGTGRLAVPLLKEGTSARPLDEFPTTPSTCLMHDRYFNRPRDVKTLERG